MSDFKNYFLQYYLLAYLEFKANIQNYINLHASDLKRKKIQW